MAMFDYIGIRGRNPVLNTLIPFLILTSRPICFLWTNRVARYRPFVPSKTAVKLWFCYNGKIMWYLRFKTISTAYTHWTFLTVKDVPAEMLFVCELELERGYDCGRVILCAFLVTFERSSLWAFWCPPKAWELLKLSLTVIARKQAW